MKKRMYKTAGVVLSAVMLAASMPCGIMADELMAEAVSGEFSEASADGDYNTGFDMAGNLNAQNYVRWTSPVYSHMYAIDGGYLKVHASDEHVYVAKYDKDMKYVADSGVDIRPELPMFGGFYIGTDGYYYIAWGRENLDEKDENEVIRVVKYDSSFKRLGSAKIYGANTNTPFKSGSLRMAQQGNFLYVRTAHRMYKNEKGQNHQANMTFEIETSSMELLDIQSEVSNLSEGYVSHSFDQYILVDDKGNIVTLDHGDSHPRAVVLGVYGTVAGNTDFSRGGFKYNEILPIKGADTSNASGVALGALDYSAASYIVAGSSVAQDNSWSVDNEYKGRNIFVSIVDRTDISKSKLFWYTSYKPEDDVFASVPQMVKVSDSAFLLLWNEIDASTQKANGKYHYLLIDDKGAKKSDIGNGAGYITDCAPVAGEDGSVIWFTDNGTKQFFYTVDKDLKALDPVMDTAKESEFAPVEYDSSMDKDDSSSSSSKKDSDTTKEEKEKEKEEKEKEKEEKEKEKEEAQRAADMENAAVSENGKFYLVRGTKAYLDGAKKVKKDKTYNVQYTPEKIVKLNARGYVSGKAEGSCTIKLVSQGKTTTYKVVVVEPEVSKKIYVNKGESAVIPIKVKVLTGQNFVSSDTDSVEVNEVSGNGVVKAKDGKGAKISYTIGRKKYKTTVVICSQEIVGKDMVTTGASLKLKLSGGAPGETKWESSNSSVATVDEKGVVSALKKGKVTISATNNGKTVTKKISVE